MKPTGPGKVNTSLTPPGAAIGGVVALLFNFDFDGVTVKPEHQAFLLAHFVPPLAAAGDLRVFLRGTASQLGNADYNLQLSRGRVEAVRNVLLGKGVRPAQIVTTFTGENLSTSLIADDERDRAVEAILEASTGPARFDRVVPVETLDGFHGKRNPQGMVVGNTEVGFVRLLGARGAIVESLVPGVVRVTDAFRPAVFPVVATSDNVLLQLTPGMPGRGQVVTRFPGQVSPTSRSLTLIGDPGSEAAPNRPVTQNPSGSAELDVASVIFRKVTVSFHYVIGPSGSVGVTTARQPDAGVEQNLVGVMNRIYVGQARIVFLAPSQRVVNTTFAGPITTGTDAVLVNPAHTENIDQSARIRVFFVGMLDNSPEPDAIAHTVRPRGKPGTSFVVRDSLNPNAKPPILFTSIDQLGTVLAHECGHCFAIDHDERNQKHLMHGKNTDVIIPPDTAVAMHRNVIMP